MKWKSTIFVVLLAVLSVVALKLTGGAEMGRRQAQEDVRRLLQPEQLPVDEVARITLTHADGHVLVFERSGAQWNQTSPFFHPMDAFSIRQFVIAARELDSAQSLDPTELRGVQTLASLQLQPPAAEVKYEWPGGSLALQLGRTSVAGRAYLRIKGDDQVHVVSQKLHERALQTDPKEWRDRTIFPGAGVESERIEWSQIGGARVALVRDRKTWKMIEPAQTRLDPSARDAYLVALGSATTAGFILDQPSQQDLARFGLASPIATLTVLSEVSEPPSTAGTQRLLIGSRIGAASQDHFGMIEGHASVVRVPAAVLAALFRLPQNLIEPTGCGVQPVDVKSIVIRTGEQELKLERDLERWRAPEHSNVEVSAHAVADLLEQLTRVRAVAVEIKPYPREHEAASITLHGYNGRALDTVRIAREPGENPELQRWIMENGDNVLRIFQPTLKVRMTAADFGLSP